jgi:hypothetical protein
MTETIDTPLKLFVMDADDLEIVSTHLQDAVVKASDIAFLARERRFAFVCDRFDWTAALVDGAAQRRRTGMHFERVTAVKARGVPKGSDTVLDLLALRFEPGEGPTGTVELVFAGDAAIRLSVECLEAAMDDLGPKWTCTHQPCHD